MRLHNVLRLSLAVLALATIGCKDVTAPDPATQIDLPPFYQQLMQIPPASQCPGCIFWNHVKFFAPVGVDPVVDISIKDVSSTSPHITVLSMRRIPDPDNVCGSACTVTAWAVEVGLEAGAAGEADITFSLRANPNKKSTFRLVSTNDYFKGKG